MKWRYVDLRSAIIVTLPNAPSPERKAAAIIAEEIESAARIRQPIKGR